MYSSTLKDLNDLVYYIRCGELPPANHWNQPGWFGKRAKIMFVGQNPGMMTKDDEPNQHNRDQDVYLWAVKRSPTGKLISKIIENAGLEWDDVAYTNVVKSPTPGNRMPREDETKFYLPIILKQIELLKPKKIILLGKYAKDTMRQHISLNIDTYFADHPSYVLRIGNSVEYINKITNFIQKGT